MPKRGIQHALRNNTNKAINICELCVPHLCVMTIFCQFSLWFFPYAICCCFLFSFFYFTSKLRVANVVFELPYKLSFICLFSLLKNECFPYNFLCRTPSKIFLSFFCSIHSIDDCGLIRYEELVCP